MENERFQNWFTFFFLVFWIVAIGGALIFDSDGREVVSKCLLGWVCLYVFIVMPITSS